VDSGLLKPMTNTLHIKVQSDAGSTDQFLEDVKEGLSGSPKFLSSKYFYDREGDRLFQQIMELDEYYLTDCEYEIFSLYKQELLEQFESNCDRFHLIEFGAGDAYKTKVLISHFLQKKAGFVYNPIDISSNVIRSLVEDLGSEFPGLSIDPLNLDYFEAVEAINRKDTCKKVVLFLGSNIGNFSMEEAVEFFTGLGGNLQKGDQILTGFDLRKDPQVILAAYNDSSGITREFNLNLLKRINRDLDADFDPEAFYHYPVYDPLGGAARSYLISRKQQEVKIKAVPMLVKFNESEPIYMEISQKYSLDDINGFAVKSGFKQIRNFFDNRKYFTNSLWEKL
jgi:L-histidine N-alpha-methyltransferase